MTLSPCTAYTLLSTPFVAACESYEGRRKQSAARDIPDRLRPDKQPRITPLTRFLRQSLLANLSAKPIPRVSRVSLESVEPGPGPRLATSSSNRHRPSRGTAPTDPAKLATTERRVTAFNWNSSSIQKLARTMPNAKYRVRSAARLIISRHRIEFPCCAWPGRVDNDARVERESQAAFAGWN